MNKLSAPVHGRAATKCASGGACERGFSVFKLLFGLAAAGFLVVNGAQIFQAYYTNRVVQKCFDILAENMAKSNLPAAQEKLTEIFRLQYLYKGDLPTEFYDELHIKTTGDMLEVSSSYGVTVWPLGKVDELDEEGTYDPEALNSMNALRDKTRIDLTFEPYAISRPSSSAAR